MVKAAPNTPPLPEDKDDRMLLASILLEIRKGQKGGYGFCFPVWMPKTEDNIRLLQPLEDVGIIKILNNHRADLGVAVINRFIFERIIWDVYEATQFDGLLKYADNITPNIVVYSPEHGVGFINGNFINFKRKQYKSNKRLFDALFEAAPAAVSRLKLANMVKQDTKRKDNDSKYALSEAFTNLRKVLLVNSEVIQLQDSGKLNALTYAPDGNLIKKLLQR